MDFEQAIENSTKKGELTYDGVIVTWESDVDSVDIYVGDVYVSVIKFHELPDPTDIDEGDEKIEVTLHIFESLLSWVDPVEYPLLINLGAYKKDPIKAVVTHFVEEYVHEYVSFAKRILRN